MAALNLSANTSVPTSVVFTASSYSESIPASSSTSLTVTAQVKDQFNTVISGFYPIYSLQGFHCGVSINSTTGLVTIQPGAMPGTVGIVASYGSITSNVSLTLSNSISYAYYAYIEPADSNLAVGETLFLDLMLFGSQNYTQIAAEIAFNTALLEYSSYTNLHGWAASVTNNVANKVAILSIPSMNMSVGAPCSPVLRIVTLKFSVKDGFVGDSTDTDLSFASIKVSPLAGVSQATIAPGAFVTVTLYKEEG
jgi:hypothetical protein